MSTRNIRTNIPQEMMCNSVMFYSPEGIDRCSRLASVVCIREGTYVYVWQSRVNIPERVFTQQRLPVSRGLVVLILAVILSP